MVKSVDPLLITAIIAALLQYVQIENASVVELVDTRDSKSRALKSVPVRVRPLVPRTPLYPSVSLALRGFLVLTCPFVVTTNFVGHGGGYMVLLY